MRVSHNRGAHFCSETKPLPERPQVHSSQAGIQKASCRAGTEQTFQRAALPQHELSFYLIRAMERLYSWMCWMISSSNRSVMVSKSANVSVWKEAGKRGLGEGVVQGRALGTSPSPLVKHRGTSWGCAHTQGEGRGSGFNIKKRSPESSRCGARG